MYMYIYSFHKVYINIIYMYTYVYLKTHLVHVAHTIVLHHTHDCVMLHACLSHVKRMTESVEHIPFALNHVCNMTQIGL